MKKLQDRGIGYKSKQKKGQYTSMYSALSGVDADKKARYDIDKAKNRYRRKEN